jgi:hypothetical protein
MNIERLFQVIVVGGSVLASGCAHNTSKQVVAPSSETETPDPLAQTAIADESPPATDEPLDCATTCEFDASGVICPDPLQDNSMGCCWLMMTPHECCYWEPEVRGE